MTHVRVALVIACLGLVVACGGGGGNSAGSSRGSIPAPTSTSTSLPNAKLTLTIVPSTVIHGVGKRKGASKKRRRPQFVDPCCDSVLYLNFYPQNYAPSNSAPSTSAGPIPVASNGPTSATIPVFSGSGWAYGYEYDDEDNLLATNSWNGTFYTLDPGTTEAISMTLSLEPAFIFLTTDQTFATPATDANQACIYVGLQNQSQTFALIPADADDDYTPFAPASTQTPPPNGLNGSVALSNIQNGSDGGGTSTIVPTGATWNGYAVYNFVYTPAGDGDFLAPPVQATATTFDPYNGTFTEGITFSPENCGG
jgi:YD repeat-containing protein